MCVVDEGWLNVFMRQLCEFCKTRLYTANTERALIRDSRIRLVIKGGNLTPRCRLEPLDAQLMSKLEAFQK